MLQITTCTEDDLLSTLHSIQLESRFSNSIISIVPSFKEQSYYIIYK